MAPQQPGPIARGAGNVGSSGEDWDDIFLATLQRQDPRQLRDLLARCNPDVVMPAKRELSPIGQAVVLTLIHRVRLRFIRSRGSMMIVDYILFPAVRVAT